MGACSRFGSVSGQCQAAVAACAAGRLKSHPADSLGGAAEVAAAACQGCAFCLTETLAQICITELSDTIRLRTFLPSFLGSFLFF